MKVEEGMCDGRVLFHAHVEKSDAERAALQERKETAVQLKDARRKQQARRVAYGSYGASQRRSPSTLALRMNSTSQAILLAENTA